MSCNIFSGVMSNIISDMISVLMDAVSRTFNWRENSSSLNSAVYDTVCILYFDMLKKINIYEMTATDPGLVVDD